MCQSSLFFLPFHRFSFPATWLPAFWPASVVLPQVKPLKCSEIPHVLNGIQLIALHSFAATQWPRSRTRAVLGVKTSVASCYAPSLVFCNFPFLAGKVGQHFFDATLSYARHLFAHTPFHLYNAQLCCCSVISSSNNNRAAMSRSSVNFVANIGHKVLCIVHIIGAD